MPTSFYEHDADSEIDIPEQDIDLDELEALDRLEDEPEADDG